MDDNLAAQFNNNITTNMTTTGTPTTSTPTTTITTPTTPTISETATLRAENDVLRYQLDRLNEDNATLLSQLELLLSLDRQRPSNDYQTLQFRNQVLNEKVKQLSTAVLQMELQLQQYRQQQRQQQQQPTMNNNTNNIIQLFNHQRHCRETTSKITISWFHII